MQHLPHQPSPIAEVLLAEARSCLSGAAAEIRQPAAKRNVHAARRYLKRLRSLLRLMGPALGKEPAAELDKVVKKAADEFAGARRAQALQQLIAKLDADPEAKSALGAALAAHTETRATAEIGPEAAARALELLDDVRRQIRQWQVPQAGLDFYLKGLKQSYRKARHRLAGALKSEDAERLHEARKQVIHTLHHLELLHRHWPGIEGLPVEEMNALRELLGDFNDLAELRHIVKRETPSRALRKKLDRHGRRRLRKARKLSDRLFEEKPAAFARRIGVMWEQAQR